MDSQSSNEAAALKATARVYAEMFALGIKAGGRGVARANGSGAL